MNKLKIGDVVRLKSGSVSMTVRREDSNTNNLLWCDWYYEGEIRRENFFEDELELKNER